VLFELCTEVARRAHHQPRGGGMVGTPRKSAALPTLQ